MDESSIKKTRRMRDLRENQPRRNERRETPSPTHHTAQRPVSANSNPSYVPVNASVPASSSMRSEAAIRSC